MKKHDSKDETLKKGYHRLLVAVGVTIAFVSIACWLGKPYLKTTVGELVMLVVPLTGIAVFAKRHRKMLEEEGVTGVEWQGYIWKQPLMKLVAFGMAIVMVISIFKMLK